jgi:alanine-synthesizing transaminase
VPGTVTFSSRVPPNLQPNAITAAVSRLRAHGTPFTDLTESNPTRVGLAYPSALNGVLREIDVVTYEPDPFGLPSARDAVAADYARRGVGVSRDRIVLTASSSESYAFLLKVLCNPGDTVLVPVPSYPLFEHLAALEGVCTRAYRLEHHGVWTIDAEALEQAVDQRTRAVFVVSPNNPTGSRLRRFELEAVSDLCRRRGLVLVGDEVFADYVLSPAPDAASVLDQSDVLTVALGGLSKSAGLPHAKLGWMAVHGPDAQVSALLERLELVADTYLSVSTLVQRAAPQLLQLGGEIRQGISDRVLLNFAVVNELAAAFPSCGVLPADGGWSAVVRAPATEPDEDRVLRLLDRARVLVHPGYFFDFDRDGYLVVSLLPPPEEFRAAIGRLFHTLTQH